ncbi:hypothetical protein GGH96_003289 [Coemansia sp. RSA 1972]|nr:hypothetical protein GGH96_003289 [Coemansia sp. RSA 1972]
MEVEINPITLETTKRLARLYGTNSDGSPDSDSFPSASNEGLSSVLDTFFAADFIPPTGKRASNDSYGEKYVRYLSEFAQDQAQRHSIEQSVDEMALELETREQWESNERERMLARAILVQVQIERLQLSPKVGVRLAQVFAVSQLPFVLWRAVQQHAANDSVRADELEVAIELLYLFSTWAEPNGMRSMHHVATAIELFVRYARHKGRTNVGRVQRLRLGHKALMLAQVTWRLEVGDEAHALQRIGGSVEGRREMAQRGLARDAIRQMRVAGAKHPGLADEVRGAAAKLLPLVHPFDGHLTRVTQAEMFGPMRTRGREPTQGPVQGPVQGPMQGSESLLPESGAAEDEAAVRRRWAGRAVPRAARDAIAASIAAVRATRSEREYAEWWRRLVSARGMPLSLTLNSAPARKGASDITINYDGRRGQYEFCGIVEAEDLPGLEAALDGHPAVWPTGTDPEPHGAAHVVLYSRLFPMLPQLARALVLTIVNWAPAERELPARHFLANVGPPQASEATCLGIVKYPRPEPDTAPLSPLSGNVKRLVRAPSRGSVNQASVSTDDVPAEVAARLLAQYAQWQAVGSLLMLILVGLQANHVLQADYFAQLLMNENIIPALFWWLGTARLDMCTQLPQCVRAHTFTAMFAEAENRREGRSRSQTVESQVQHSDFVGCDTSDASDANSGSTISVDSTKSDSTTASDAWMPALHGIVDCMRGLRRLTSHNGLRKGLLYKNKALYFYGRLQRVASSRVREIAAELIRDIMPVVSRRQKQSMLDVISQVYEHAPPLLGDAFWLADYALDPQIEMHRHVELLRLLHFYHHQVFGMRLPRDPALFPSLAGQAVDVQVPQVRSHKLSGQAVRKEFGRMCGQSGSWAWESELEDVLNDVCAVRTSST